MRPRIPLRVGLTDFPGGEEQSDKLAAQQLVDQWTPLVGTELYAKTVGLVGFGRIARAVARRLTGFDCRILAYDPVLASEAARAMGVQLVALDELLRESDFVSLHLPLMPETRRLISAAALSSMKPGAILINTARGGLIDEAALAEALESGQLGGAGLDVFEGEADATQRDLIVRLLSMPNVIASAHAAGSSREGLERTNAIAAQCVIDVLDGGRPPDHCIVAEGHPNR